MIFILLSLSRKLEPYLDGVHRLVSSFMYKSVLVTISFEAKLEVQATNWQMKSQLQIARWHLQTLWLPSYVCFGCSENWESFGKAICSNPSGLCFSFGLKSGFGRGSEGWGEQFCS